MRLCCMFIYAIHKSYTEQSIIIQFELAKYKVPKLDTEQTITPVSAPTTLILLQSRNTHAAN